MKEFILALSVLLLLPPVDHSQPKNTKSRADIIIDILKLVPKKPLFRVSQLHPEDVWLTTLTKIHQLNI